MRFVIILPRCYLFCLTMNQLPLNLNHFPNRKPRNDQNLNCAAISPMLVFSQLLVWNSTRVKSAFLEGFLSINPLVWNYRCPCLRGDLSLICSSEPTSTTEDARISSIMVFLQIKRSALQTHCRRVNMLQNLFLIASDWCSYTVSSSKVVSALSGKMKRKDFRIIWKEKLLWIQFKGIFKIK